MPHTKAKIAAALFPKHVPLIDQVNNNARVAAWIRQHRGVRRFRDRESLYAYVNAEICGHEAIDYLEFGVFEGLSLRSWLGLNRHPDSRFVGFDSFQGLPETWTARHGLRAFDTGGREPQVDDERAHFVRGWFQDTLPTMLAGWQPRARLVVHNDSDLYSSTLYALTMLDRLLVPGSIVIFDEFCVAMHEFRAFHDYLAAYRREASPIAMTDDYATQVAMMFR